MYRKSLVVLESRKPTSSISGLTQKKKSYLPSFISQKMFPTSFVGFEKSFYVFKVWVLKQKIPIHILCLTDWINKLKASQTDDWITAAILQLLISKLS